MLNVPVPTYSKIN